MSGIPVEELRKRKKDSKLALRAMREIQDQKHGGSFVVVAGRGSIHYLDHAVTENLILEEDIRGYTTRLLGPGSDLLRFFESAKGQPGSAKNWHLHLVGCGLTPCVPRGAGRFS